MRVFPQKTALSLISGCMIYVSQASTFAAGQDMEPKEISLKIVRCLVDNAGWLQALPDDPLEFFGDLCPASVDRESIENSVRIGTPDVSMRPDPTAAPPVRLAIRKDGLKCLVQHASTISAPSVDLSWGHGVVIGVEYAQTKLDLGNCSTTNTATAADRP
ncbi:hypothetical protein WNZ14_19170 [Hoeflea sp. AS60]|uniref:hypothetical protein n=1 Tax=Hoeflea sp. AS60 TaxID=3135780 RepID=UPI003180323C